MGNLFQAKTALCARKAIFLVV